MNPTVRAVKFNGVKPAIKGAFIASSASVVGKVTIGPRTSILYGAIVRGDVSTITIGESVTIGENTMIHCSSKPKEIPTVIGNNVVVGPSSILHGCILEDGSQIGEGSQVMDGARIEKFAFVAPGSLVAQGKVVPTGQLWGGVPAKFQRNLTQEEITKMSAVVEENVTLSSIHAKEDIKTWKEIDEDNFYYDNIFDPYHPILREVTNNTLFQQNFFNYFIPFRISFFLFKNSMVMLILVEFLIRIVSSL